MLFPSCNIWMLLATLLVANSDAAPTLGKTEEAMIYLARYGYLPSAQNQETAMMISKSSWKTAIEEFQRFANLKVTGVLDDETIHKMSVPRCGIQDKDGSKDKRVKRYVLQEGWKWNKRNLTYNISKYPSDRNVTYSQVDAQIARAFEVWSSYTDLDFTEKKSGNVDIDISFVRGDHGDGSSINGVLAHAWPPYFYSNVNDIFGDIHFNDLQDWKGNHVFEVALHEIGHSLGLAHSEIGASVMSGNIYGRDPVHPLNKDDIDGIQKLYGPKTLPRFTKAPTTSKVTLAPSTISATTKTTSTTRKTTSVTTPLPTRLTTNVATKAPPRNTTSDHDHDTLDHERQHEGASITRKTTSFTTRAPSSTGCQSVFVVILAYSTFPP